MDPSSMVSLRTALHRAEVKEGIAHDSHAIPLTNRGHKLDAPTETVSTLAAVLPPDDIEYEDPRDASDLDVDAAQILQPISDPAEVSSHLVIKRIFTSPFLKTLSDELLDILVKEKDDTAQIVKLMDAMLGDDDLALMPQVMAKMDTPAPYPTPEPGQPLPKVDDDMQSFFRLPEIKVDRDLGLDTKEAQMLREKLQVAQQRMLEYVRSMVQLRRNLTRAQRLRRTVLNWCREMNGEDYVKEDLDSQNNFDNEGLSEQPQKDVYHG